jgi:hypothetical protein
VALNVCKRGGSTPGVRPSRPFRRLKTAAGCCDQGGGAGRDAVANVADVADAGEACGERAGHPWAGAGDFDHGVEGGAGGDADRRLNVRGRAISAPLTQPKATLQPRPEIFMSPNGSCEPCWSTSTCWPAEAWIFLSTRIPPPMVLRNLSPRDDAARRAAPGSKPHGGHA